MNLTNEQIQAILDGAPEGATHYQSTTYLRYDSKRWVWWSEVENGWCFVRDESLGWAKLLGGHHGSLSDLREILTLRQEVERLKAQQSEVAARAVEDAAKDLSSLITAPPGKYSVTVLKLREIANQLRERNASTVDTGTHKDDN